MNRLWLVRLVLETKAPLAINSGSREIGFDHELVRDVNGLPFIPASSFTGVWRHKAQSILGEEISKQWFGTMEQAEQNKLFIQNGLLIDSNSQVVQGLVSAEYIANDPLLNQLSQSNPFHRERVRINDRGVASNTGKFDQVMLPKGIRFVIDLRWHQTPAQAGLEEQWQQLLGLIAAPDFALGSSTRNGLGRFNVVNSDIRQLELNQNASLGQAIVDFAKRQDLPNTQKLPVNTAQPFAKIQVGALGSWRVGEGMRPLSDKPNEHSDRFTYSEPFVTWKNGRAQWSDKPQAVLCGSSIKGILAHSVAYHYRRLTKQFAKNVASSNHADWEARPAELAELFGSEDTANPIAGRLFVEDTVIDAPQTLHRTYTSIDRFTGGVREGKLFSEELLWEPTLTLTLHLAAQTTVNPVLKQALETSLEDLKDGLLPIGSGSSRGISLVIHKANQVWEIDWSQLHTSIKE